MTDRPRINVPLLQKTMDHIEAHPEEWDQANWFCGTKACFAGHAVLLAGAQKVDDPNLAACGFLVPYDGEPVIILSGAPMTGVGTRAKQLLGLTEDESGALFRGGNTMDDLRARVAELVVLGEAQERAEAQQ